MNLEVRTTIEKPLDDVWRALEPIERHVDWMADAESITFTSSATRGVGTTFDCVTKVGPIRLTDRMAITEWSPPRVMGIEHRGAVTGNGRFTLDAITNTRTAFTWTEQLRFPWWMGGEVGAVAAAPGLRAIWRRNLRRLKQMVEDS